MEAKQNPSIQIQRYRPLILALGLLISLLLVLSAFNYKSKLTSPEVIEVDQAYFETPLIPRTVIEPPKPPQPKSFELIAVNDPEEVSLEDIYIDTEYDIDESIDEVIFLPEEPAEVAEEIFLAPQQEAAFPGGNKAWMQYLRKNFKYPIAAQRMGIEGRVFVQFTVDKQGYLSDIQVIRGIGGGCNEEAIRVIQNSPKWNPGKQRGIPVKSRRTIAIIFKLQ